jgi:predicted nucleic acid-binding protein
MSGVIDASAAIEALFGDEVAGAALSEIGVFAPEVVDLELTSALRKMVLRGEAPRESLEELLADWAGNDVVRCPHVPLLERVWAMRDRITAYDASYVALAEQLGLPLVTADRRLASVAQEFCEVRLVGQA